MKIKTILSCLFLIALINRSEAQKNLLELIPNEALYVATLHAKSIDDKVGWQNLGKYQFVEELARRSASMLAAEEEDLVRSVILQPQNFGIDLSGNSYAFMELNNEDMFISGVFRLSNSAKFKEALQGYYGNEINTLIQTKGKYLVLFKNGITIAWQQDHAIISFAQIQSNWEEETDQYESRKAAIVEKYINTIYNLEPNESYSQIQAFHDWEKTVRDAGIWFDYAKIMELIFQQNSYPRQMLPLLLDFYADMNIGSDISFDKGAIRSETQVFSTPQLMKLANSIAQSKANKRFLSYVDGENVVMYMTTSMSPKGLYEGWKNLLKEKAGKMESVVTDMFGIMEIFIDEKAAFNFLKGDLFFAINGVRILEMTETDYEYDTEKETYEPIEKTVKRPMPIFVMSFSYGKKEDMMKFVRILEKLGFLTPEKNGCYKLTFPGSNRMDIYLKLDAGMVVISNDADRLLEGKKYKPLSKNHSAFLTKDMQTVYFNTSNAVDAILLSETTTMVDKNYFKNIKDGVGDLFLHTLRPKATDKSIRQDFILELKNKDENALKQLFDFANRVYLNTLKGI